MTKKTLMNVVLTGLESQRCYNDKKKHLNFCSSTNVRIFSYRSICVVGTSP